LLHDEEEPENEHDVEVNYRVSVHGVVVLYDGGRSNDHTVNAENHNGSVEIELVGEPHVINTSMLNAYASVQIQGMGNILLSPEVIAVFTVVEVIVKLVPVNEFQRVEDVNIDKDLRDHDDEGEVDVEVEIAEFDVIELRNLVLSFEHFNDY
jgi:hypothetical protein